MDKLPTSGSKFSRWTGAQRSADDVSNDLNRTDEWLVAASGADGAASDANLDISEEFYFAILKALKLWAKIRQPGDIKGIAAKLYLWGRDYSDGKLSMILSQANELRDTVLSLLQQIGRLVLQDIKNQMNEDHRALHELRSIEDLSSLLDRASLITTNETKKDRFPLDACPSSPNGSACELFICSRDEDASLDEEPCDASSEDEAMSTSSSQDELDTVGSIQDLTARLLDLIPALEQSYSHLQLPRKAHQAQKQEFSVSLAALPFVQSVADRFKNADKRLLERLGESNWQRFNNLRQKSKETSMVTLQEQVPKSVFKPQTLFHDSGLGSSIVTVPYQTPSAPLSVASHSSFASSVEDQEKGTFRVPKTPAAVFDEVPFDCQICNRIQYHIKNRNHWKMHVFADLNPYICTYDTCNCQLTTFATREQWANHEFSEHRIIRVWSCPECAERVSSTEAMEQHLITNHRSLVGKASSKIHAIVCAAMSVRPAPIEDQNCPLCLCIPGKSKRNFVKHVAQHLEAIALAVLPPDPQDDSDTDSDRQSVSSDTASIHNDDDIATISNKPMTQEFERGLPGNIRDESPHSTIALYNGSSGQDGSERGRCPHPGCGLIVKDLKAHMITHQAERPEKCPIVTCEYHTKGFARKYDQCRHALMHYKGRMVCNFCPNWGTPLERYFNRVDVFKHHLTSVHSVEQRPPNAKKPPSNQGANTARCPTCSSSFANAQDLYDHLDACVLNFLWRGDPRDDINEQHLRAIVHDDAVNKTLKLHMLPYKSLETSGGNGDFRARALNKLKAVTTDQSDRESLSENDDERADVEEEVEPPLTPPPDKTSDQTAIMDAELPSEKLISGPGWDSDAATQGSEQEEPRYCYCNEPSHGEMIACDSNECEREWFHLPCVGMTKPPPARAKWYCDACKSKQKSTAKKTAAGKKAPTKKKAPAEKKAPAKIFPSDDSGPSGAEDEHEVYRSGGFHKPLTLSAPLSALLDGETQLSRPQAVKRIWEYVKAHDLQDPKDKRQIRCDDALRAVFKRDKVHMFTMNKILATQMYDPDL